MSYLSDFNQVYPTYPVVNDVYTCWDWQISSYLSYQTNNDPTRETWGPPIFHCPNGAVHTSNTAVASRGYAMNFWVASPSSLSGGTSISLNSGFGNHNRDGQQVLVAEVWRQSYGMGKGIGGVGYPEVLVFGKRSNTQYIWTSSGDAVDMAYRHDDNANFLMKDGHVASADFGNSGFGRDMIWFFRDDGLWFKDGYRSN